MQLLALSLSYRTATLSLRERVSFPQEAVPGALADLRRSLAQSITETALLSTCNRTEIYGAATDPEAACSALTRWLAGGSVLLGSELRCHFRPLSGEDAARHVFRVASGLDSLLIGEPQILGQLKGAARNAHAAGTLGPLLHQLFQRAFAVAKAVRTRTDIGTGVLSHGSASVEVARGLFRDLSATRVLFIGAGTIVDSVAPHFAAHKPREIVVANRTRERGERIARRLSARTCGLAQLGEDLQRYDIVVSCTSSVAPLVTAAMMQRALAARRGRPLLIVDLGVPRDVEPAVAKLPGVALYTIDDLGKLVQPHLRVRTAAVAQAADIIEAHLKSFVAWMRLRPCVPLMRRLNEQVERLHAAELARSRRRLAHGEPVERVLSSLATGLANKLLHPPRTLLRGSATPEEAERFLDHWIGALERGARL